MQLMQLENPHFDWAFWSISAHDSFTCDRSFQTESPAMRSILCQKMTATRFESSGRWNHIKWFLPSSPQPSNLRFYSGFLMVSRLVFSVWTYEYISASPGRESVQEATMLEKSIYLNLVGGLDQIDLTTLLYAMHLFATSILRCLIFQDRIWIYSP